MATIVGLLLAAAGVLATIWAGFHSTSARKLRVFVDLSQSVALPPAATDPLDFYSISVRNLGALAVRFPRLCVQLQIKGWTKGFVYVPRTDALDHFMDTPHGPFSDSRFPYTLEPGFSFTVLVSREAFDRLMSGKGKVGGVRVQAVVIDDVKRTFRSKAIRSTIADYRNQNGER